MKCKVSEEWHPGLGYMGKIIYLMGKSSTGKDTIYRRLMQWNGLSLKKIVLYTTRPIRTHEKDGREYFFTDETHYQQLLKEGKIIEEREYQTVYGPWRYFTVDDGSIDLSKGNYLVIGTLESYIKTREYFSNDRVIPVYIEVDDGVRLERALQRERRQQHPGYEEMCRRFLADAKDFSVENLEKAGITKIFENDELERCVSEIEEYLLTGTEIFME